MRLLLLLLLTLPLLSLPFSLLRSPLVSTRSSPPLFLFTNFPASAANTSSPLPDVASFSQELQIAASKFTNAFFETPASVCDPVTTNCTTNTTDSLINKDLQKAINAYRQNAGVGRLAGNTSTTDADIYKALKDNVLSSPDTLLRSIKKDDDEEVVRARAKRASSRREHAEFTSRSFPRRAAHSLPRRLFSSLSHARFARSRTSKYSTPATRLAEPAPPPP